MKMSKIWLFIRDVITRFKLSMKLLLRDRITVAVFILASVCFFLICATLNFSAGDQSRIPIGFVNLDLDDVEGEEVATTISQDLVDSVSNSAIFRIVLGDMNSLELALKHGEVNAIFVINRGYHDRVKSGSTTQLITVYKSTENKTANLLSDIFAGEMIDQICLNKSYTKYRRLDFDGYEQLSHLEYVDYVNQMILEDEFKFAFDIKLLDVKDTTSNVKYDKLENSVLYRQVVAGIFAMLLSFAVLFSFTYVCMEKEQGIIKRKQLVLSNKIAELIGTLTAVIATTCMLCLIFVSCICYYANTREAFWPLLFLSFEYVCMMAVIFMLLVKVTNGVLTYQMIGAVLILILGFLGFATMLDGLVFRNLVVNLENTPNGWFIRSFVDIIVNT